LRIAAALCVSLACAGAATPAAANSYQSLSHDQVREAVLAGRLAPLNTILGAVRSAFERQMVDVRALVKGDAYLFEVLMIEEDGAVLQLYYDARTARLLAWTGVGGESEMDGDAFIDSVFLKLERGAAASDAPADR
jgi:hypothetical protein